jgi:hypothetical protein
MVDTKGGRMGGGGCLCEPDAAARAPDGGIGRPNCSKERTLLQVGEKLGHFCRGRGRDEVLW